SMTRYLSEDPYRELPDPRLYEGRKAIDLEINDPFYRNLQSDRRVQIARDIEAAAMAVSDKIISTTASCSDTYYERVQVHSNGFVGEEEGTYFSAGAEATVQGEEGKRPEDWFYASTRFFNMLPQPEVLGKQASERALKKIGQKKMASAKLSMLVENRAAGRLFWALRGPLSGRSLQQKRSYLEGMLNKKIAAEVLTVTDDPFIKKGLSSRLFDSEGIAAKVMPIVEKGILKNYFIDTYYGKKVGMEPTTRSSSNTVFKLGRHSLEELIAQVKKGILITSFIGGNSNSTTGDFSFGLQGFYIENGHIVQPVSEMNISGNMKDLWHQLVELGNDPYPYSSLQCPSLLFEGVQFSGL
ncbi:MAG: TldD/PmbA family protein, partial [candidate division KSB1 bacterium]|nr:TldD/PmbA family protein [candidate division KSB1 bacterium]